MKLAHLLFGSSALLIACSSDGTTADGGSDTSAPGQDGSTSMDATTADTSVSDTGADASDAGAADAPFEASIGCTSPAQCGDGGNAQACCINISLGAGMFPQCMVNNFQTSCKANNMCATQLGIMCNSMQQFRACTNNSQCTEIAYNKCCAFNVNNQMLSFCANTQLAQLGGGTCQ